MQLEISYLKANFMKFDNFTLLGTPMNLQKYTCLINLIVLPNTVAFYLLGATLRLMGIQMQ